MSVTDVLSNGEDFVPPEWLHKQTPPSDTDTDSTARQTAPSGTDTDSAARQTAPSDTDTDSTARQ